MENIRSLCLLIGRIALSAIFITSGVGKILHWGDTVQMVSSQGVPMASFMLGAAVALELVGSLLVITGYKVEIGVFFLIAFLIPVTLVFHPFWAIDGEANQLQTIMFMKNVAMLGGLLALGAAGPGYYSLGHPTKDLEEFKKSSVLSYHVGKAVKR